MTVRGPNSWQGALVSTAIAALASLPLSVQAQTNAQDPGRAILVDTADPAISTAQEIIVDLPSARHASRYQRGETNGLRYVLYPDGSGKVMQTDQQRAVLYRLNCASGTDCTIENQNGTRTTVTRMTASKPAVPTAPDGEALAQYLAEWVLARTPAPAEAPSAEVAVTSEASVPALSTSAAKPAQPARKIYSPRKATPSRPAKRTKRVGINAPIRTKQAPKLAHTAQPKETYFQRINLSCSITGSVTLQYTNHNTGAERFGKPRTNLSCGARFSDKLSLRVSVLGYLDSNEKGPDDAEFTYALNYRATDKLTFTYSNYSARFSDGSNAFRDSLSSGNLRASYKLPKIKLPNDKTIGCSAGIGLAKAKENRASLFCSYALTDKIRISGTAYAYFPGKQDPWDPDFSYTASYRINDDWRVTYSNYANNRFFWNKTNSTTRGLLGGSLSVTYAFKF